MFIQTFKIDNYDYKLQYQINSLILLSSSLTHLGLNTVTNNIAEVIKEKTLYIKTNVYYKKQNYYLATYCSHVAP